MPSEEELGYTRIMQNLVPHPIHPFFRPVDLSENQKTVSAVGTLTLNHLGQPTSVITAAHIFKLGQDYQQLFYRVLQPLSNMFFPISKAVEVRNEDVAMCILGPAAPIKGFSRHTGGQWDGRKATVCRAEYADCTMLTTGWKVPVLGHAIVEGSQECYYILDYQGCSGESGSAFLKGGNDIYVLKGKLAVTEALRNTLLIDKPIEHVTVAAGITVNH